MAEERLTLLMRARGGRRARKDVDEVGDAVGRLGTGMKKDADHAGLFARGLNLPGMRMGMMIIVGGGLAAVLGGPLAGGLIALAAGAVAAGGALIPLGLLAVGVMQRFKTMAGTAGSAANDLQNAMGGMKQAFATAIAPGADIVMRALAQAIQMLIPLMTTLQGPLTIVAHAAALAIHGFAVALSQMGPLLGQMFTAAAPIIAQMGPLFGAMTVALVHLAIAGMPVLALVVHWLILFFRWLTPAIDDTNRFVHSAAFLSRVAVAWRILGMVARFVAGVIRDLAVIAYQLFLALEPVLKIVGGALLWALNGLGGALHWVAQNMSWIGPIVAPLITAFAAWQVITLALAAADTVLAAGIGLVSTALGVLDALFLSSPIGWVVLTILAMAAAVYLLAKHWGDLSTKVKIALVAIMVGLAPLTGGLSLLVLGIAMVIRHFGWFKNAAGNVWRALGSVWGAGKRLTTFLNGVFVGALRIAWTVLRHTPISYLIGTLLWLNRRFHLVSGAVHLVGRAASWLWGIIRRSPFVRLATWAWHAVGGLRGMANVLKTVVVGAFNVAKAPVKWFVDKIKWLVDHAKAIGDIVGKGASIVGKVADLAPHLAGGGFISRGGAAVVGERGPELVALPGGAAVVPHGAPVHAAPGGGDTVIHTHMYIDGKPVAEAVHRQARRKKSTR